MVGSGDCGQALAREQYRYGYGSRQSESGGHPISWSRSVCLLRTGKAFASASESPRERLEKASLGLRRLRSHQSRGDIIEDNAASIPLRPRRHKLLQFIVIGWRHCREASTRLSTIAFAIAANPPQGPLCTCTEAHRRRFTASDQHHVARLPARKNKNGRTAEVLAELAGDHQRDGVRYYMAVQCFHLVLKHSAWTPRLREEPVMLEERFRTNRGQLRVFDCQLSAS